MSWFLRRILWLTRLTSVGVLAIPARLHVTLVDVRSMKAPIPSNGSTYDARYIMQWRNAVIKEASIPSMPMLDAFRAAIVDFEKADKEVNQAEKEVEKLTKQKADEKTLESAKSRVAECKACQDQRRDTAESIAHGILDQMQGFLNQPLESTALIMVAAAMMEAGAPKGMAFEQQVKQYGHEGLIRLFCDIPLLTRFMSAGGPSQNAYARALQIYSSIPVEQDPVLQRLALAVALELCAPVELKVGSGYEIDPLKRYLHYKQAYLAGELDPIFSTLAVWEMRMVVDSDARDEELVWGRECLRNYRPDLCYLQNPQWRYCMIVKQDVGYNNPVWWRKNADGKAVRTYDQILSGGGKCGPRAWYGRFACKAFGIPTWGCKQPGHAALVRHTTQGWMTCLGGGIHKSYWGAVTGNDFLWMTQARYSCRTDEEYMKKVLRLEWIATALGEDRKAVSRIADPNSKAPWFSLALFQRKRLGKACVDSCPPLHPRSAIGTMYDKIMQQKEEKEQVTRDGRAIVVPATAFTEPPKQNNKVKIHKSFMGGCQLFIQGEADFGYTLENCAGRYNLTIMVCTVHREEGPLHLTINQKDKREIPIPYTMGEWEETEPIELVIAPGVAKLALKRGTKQYGFAIMQLRLEPA